MRLLLFRCMEQQPVPRQHAGDSVLLLQSLWLCCMALADEQTLPLLLGAGTQGTEEHFNSQGIVCGQRKSSGKERIALCLPCVLKQ